jgi:serine/threonine-protein kinase
MSDVFSRDGASLPLSAELRIDKACREFEAAWNDGKGPRIEDYFGDAAGEEREELLRDLTRLEKELQGKALASTLPLPPRAQAAPPATAHGWELLEEIGRGGIGVVHRWRDHALRRDLAVKLLREKYRDNADLRRRFVEEAQIGAQLQHPGVAPVHELGELPDGRPYFTMKLIRGRTLAELLGQRKSPADDLPRFVAIFEQVCQTLAYAHAHGVIHRDLKPANVMVGEFGEVQVMDWGLAKVLANREGPPPQDAVTDKAAGEKRVVVETLRDDATEVGRVMGTYAYMPPEQARGEVARLDERCDMFGLGAILCEILTGSPPYTGDHLVVHGKAEAGDLEDAFGRLDGCGADPELVRIARGCLAAKPEGRPQEAGAVVTAVTAYLAGVQERLRATELERAAAQAREAEAKAKAKAERRARRVTVGLAASVLLTAALLGGGGGWLLWRRAETTTAAETDLNVATAAVKRGDDKTAGQALERIEWRLGGGGFDSLRQQVADLRHELDFAAELEEAPMKTLETPARSPARNDNFDWEAADAAYARAFSDRGLDVTGPGASAALERIGRSPIRDRITAALDTWSYTRRWAGLGGWKPLLEAAARVDESGDVTRRQLREAILRDDTESLVALAGDPGVADWPAADAVMLSAALGTANEWGMAERALRAAVARNAGDFWLNMWLEHSLASPQDEGIGFLRAAVAARPRAVAARVVLGNALLDQGKAAEAEKEFREALRLKPNDALVHIHLGYALSHLGKAGDAEQECREALRLEPNDAAVHNNFGGLLDEQGKAGEAEREYHEALRLNPKYAPPHFNLAGLLVNQGKAGDAEKEIREALRLRPDFAWSHLNLGTLLANQGKTGDAEKEYREALRLDPAYPEAHFNLGVLLVKQGKAADAEKEYRKALRLKPDYAGAHNNLGLLLKDQGKAAEAEKEYREAIRLKPDFAEAHYNLGNSLLGQNRPAEAEKEYREVLRIMPDDPEAHCNLGAALRDQGRFRDGLKEYNRGHEIGSRDPRWPRASTAGWVSNCRRLVELDGLLPAILFGEAEPTNAAASIGFARVCFYTGRYAAAARFYAAASAADPAPFADVSTGVRYNAGCVAALAGCDQGEDAPASDADRARLRAQALDWLRADLGVCAKAAGSGDPNLSAEVRQKLQDWRQNPEFAGVRDKLALENLPQAEREQWRPFWNDVDALLQKVSAPSGAVPTTAR